MKEKKDTKQYLVAPDGKIIVRGLIVKSKESNIIIPDTNKDQKVAYDYHPLQAEVVVVGNSNNIIDTTKYNVGDVVILGVAPREEQRLVWDGELLFSIRPDQQVIAILEKNVKGKFQHIYEK